VIRAATVDDAPAIAALEARLFGTDAWTLEQVVEELTGPGRAAWVSTLDALAGYVITWSSGDATDLLRIAVAPEQQRRGLATELLEAARPSTRWLLEVADDNAAALAFYRKHGFVEIDRRPRYYRDGRAAVVMERMAP